jgi:hypothetical protein
MAIVSFPFSSVASGVARGKFSATFFLTGLADIELTRIDLEDI